MAKKVIWSSKAQNERKEILEYWFICNGNKRYSRKLGSEFTHAAKIISDFNHIGKKTKRKEIRYYLSNNYKLFYKESDVLIEILTIFDTRRNPKDLKLN